MSDAFASEDVATVCARHPSVETHLRCGRCGTPICPRCLVMTPVGARCRDCAHLRRLPTFEVGVVNYVIASVVGLASAIVLGVVGTFILDAVPYVAMFYPIGAGFVIGEVVSRSVNRKRGIGLRVVAGVGVVVSFLLVAVGDFLIHSPLGSIPVALLVALLGRALIGIVGNLFSLVFVVVGIWIAANRF